MADNQPRIPGQPKLRSSCDRCGIAKVKCDRQQPECGRCISHGIECVYGISRKFGKPPRNKLRQSMSQTSSNQASGMDLDMDSLDSISTCGIMPDLEPFPTVSDMAWDMMDFHNPNSLVNEALDTLYRETTGSSLPTVASVDCRERTGADRFDVNPPAIHFQPCQISTPRSPNLGSYSSIETPQPHSNVSSHVDGASMLPVGTREHGCAQEAYGILESLLSLHIKACSDSSPNSPTPSTPENTTNRVPLDLVLRHNRETSERLVPLLPCSCAKSPHLALLYAAIISRILTWYQQAAGCTKNAIRNPSTAPSTSDTSWVKGTSESARSPGPSVAPAKMVVGSFDVDGLREQTAIKLQLLSGEMRRAGHLIDQFILHNSAGQCRTDDGDVHSLYQSLNSWLKRDHLRIASMMRTELRELSI
ncbi:hypothetical protein FQN50_000062 [Emmonsiellopsis sp. PD_5]|nr:hypothetical protein FQN50_000062 [Emmonsiellopsis sp. PD_5]